MDCPISQIVAVLLTLAPAQASIGGGSAMMAPAMAPPAVMAMAPVQVAEIAAAEIAAAEIAAAGIAAQSGWDVAARMTQVAAMVSAPTTDDGEAELAR